ncbi:adenosylhomocysteinase [Schaalia sp. ZJ405]|uniref:adenosylhomocysteinase n=1 Tax=Schaalia sp. ZJ405 TaxID=2709403 RepID=UPI0013EC454A|nr:adenosylhomocysteinase [Schaalia sp. ZJ405]QPK81423.1 adenosylhomocysteinase [Schaalia sp. ZJ405]
MTVRDALARAQVILRRFAATSNLLIPGRHFLLRHAPISGLAHGSAEQLSRLVSALEDILTGFGAHVTVIDEDEAASPNLSLPVHVVINLGFPSNVHPGALVNVDAVTVDAPLSGQIVVWAPDGSRLLDPHDPALTDDPHAAVEYARGRIEWARQRMPVTEAAVAKLAESGILKGRRIGLALVLEPKTASLALMLDQAGARVSVFGHADETRDDIAHVLSEQGVAVFAESGERGNPRERQLARQFLTQGLEVLLDDGSHLIRLAHDDGPRGEVPGALDHLIGAAEETTSGLRPLRSFPLRIPVIASNDARSKTLFDNAYATGQSCLTTILDLVDPTLQGYPLWTQRVVVVGYGDVGQGFARFCRAMGARVRVVEVDPVRQLQAQMDGFESSPQLVGHVGDADMVVSATGEASTIPVSVLEQLRLGTVVAVAGGVDNEVELAAARAQGWTQEASSFRSVSILGAPPAVSAQMNEDERVTHVRDVNDEFSRGIVVLDNGSCINCTAGEGNPIEVMDMSFGVQVAALRRILEGGADLSAGLHPLPEQDDRGVAEHALEALGVTR